MAHPCDWFVLALTKIISLVLFQNAKSIQAFEILPQPAEMRKPDNPWPQWPLIYRQDYGHVEAKARDGKDPRTYAISTKVRSHAHLPFLKYPLGIHCGN